MKKAFLILSMMCGMPACAVDRPDRTATSIQDLICDPNCDPGNFQTLVSAVVGAGNGLGARLAGTMECYHYEGGFDPVCDCWTQTHDECAENRQDPWGQKYRVWCTTGAAGCSHRACGDTDPSQFPCNT